MSRSKIKIRKRHIIIFGIISIVILLAIPIYFYFSRNTKLQSIPKDDNKKERIVQKIPKKLDVTVKVLTETTIVLEGEYIYQPSIADDKESCHIISLEKIKRSLFEKMGTYLEDNPKVRELGITKNQIVTSLSGMLRVEIIEEKWDEKEYYIRLRTGGDKDPIIHNIHYDPLKGSDFEEISRISEKALREIEGLRTKFFASTKEFNAGLSEKYKIYLQDLKMIKAYEEGRVWQMQGANHNAINSYTHAIDLNPNFAYAYFYRGVAYCSYYNEKPGTLAYTIDCQKSINDLNKAIELLPTNAYFYFRRGFAHKDNNVVQALEDFNKSIELNPYYEIVYSERGDIYSKLGDYYKALKDFDRAIELNPKKYHLYNNRALVYSKLGNHHQAIKDFTKAIEIAPQDKVVSLARLYYNRATSLKELGKYQKAIEDFDRAIELDPQFKEAELIRSRIHERLNN